MLQIGNAIVSLDLIEKKFCCDLEKCRGRCCYSGDSGAPLENNEIDMLTDFFMDIKPFMRTEGVEIIEGNGIFTIDIEHDKVTPLIKAKDCTFSIIENGIYKCAIEKAFLDGKIDFQKPLSCHLYPVRIKRHRNFDAVNYDTRDICIPATECGTQQMIPLYMFVKDALIRKYNAEWFEQLDYAAKNFNIEK